MKTINENNGLTIEQLEERQEMVAGSSSSGDKIDDDFDIGPKLYDSSWPWY